MAGALPFARARFWFLRSDPWRSEGQLMAEVPPLRGWWAFLFRSPGLIRPGLTHTAPPALHYQPFARIAPAPPARRNRRRSFRNHGTNVMDRTSTLLLLGSVMLLTVLVLLRLNE